LCGSSGRRGLALRLAHLLGLSDVVHGGAVLVSAANIGSTAAWLTIVNTSFISFSSSRSSSSNRELGLSTVSRTSAVIWCQHSFFP
jgi:hypothetical protein